MQEFKSSIENWINDFLSKPSATFNNLPPCPFAKKAWQDNAVHTHWLNDTFEIKLIITAELENYTYHWPKGKEVVILGFDPNRISPQELSIIIDNTYELLDNRGYIALEDHPHEVEQVQDVVLNQGTYGLVLIQPKDKLDLARAMLEKQNYYKNWTPEYKQEVQTRE